MCASAFRWNRWRPRPRPQEPNWAREPHLWVLNSGHPPAPFCFCRTSSPRLFLENVYTTDISCTSFANWYLHCDNRSGAVFFSFRSLSNAQGQKWQPCGFFFGPEGGGSVVGCGTNNLTSGTAFLSHPFVCFVSSIFIVMRHCSIRPPKKKIHVGGASVVVFFFFFLKSLLAARLWRLWVFRRNLPKPDRQGLKWVFSVEGRRHVFCLMGKIFFFCSVGAKYANAFFLHFLLCGCIFFFTFFIYLFFAFFGFSPAEILAFNALKRKPVTGAEGAEENFWTILNGPFLSWTPFFPCKLHCFDFLHFLHLHFRTFRIAFLAPRHPCI